MRGVWLSMAVTVAVGCAGSPAPRVKRLYDEKGVRQEPLTEDEVGRMLQKAAPQFAICYRREMLNLSKELSSYVFRVWVPADGSGAEVETEKESVKGQVTLRECLEETITRVHFPPHVGTPIEVRVPVKGPA